MFSWQAAFQTLPTIWSHNGVAHTIFGALQQTMELLPTNMLNRYTDSSRCRKQACTQQVIFDPLQLIWSRNARLYNSVAHGWISEATQVLQESVVQDHWGSKRKRVKVFLVGHIRKIQKNRKERMEERKRRNFFTYVEVFTCVFSICLECPQATTLLWLSLKRTHSYGNLPYNLCLKHLPVIVPSKVMEGTYFDLYLSKFFWGGRGVGFFSLIR